MDEVFKQPFFGNPHIPHPIPEELNISAHVGRAMVLVGCTGIKDLSNSIIQYYKDLKNLNIRHTMASIVTHNNLMMNIPWDPGAIPSKIVLGDQVGLCHENTLEWIYLVSEAIGALILVYEFKICLDSNKLENIELQLVRLITIEILKVRVLLCKGHKGYFELVLLKGLGEFNISEAAIGFHGSMGHSGKKIAIVTSEKKSDLVIFQHGFVANLPWDPGKWSLTVVDGLGIAPFFGYSTKKNYIRNKTHYKETQSFVSRLQELGLDNK